jgi:histidine kinase
MNQMPFYQRLRLRLFASQFVVALVGVAIMMLATRVVILSSGPRVLRPLLVALVENPALLPQTEQALIIAFRNAVILSVAIAAVGAISAGLLSSYLLWQILIVPLRQVADSSYRIAQGRYAERVVVPVSSGATIAQLVINFNQMAAALEKVEEQRVALLANISHELRTPLTGLRGYLEGLVDGLFPSNEETFGWMLAEVDRLTRLVNDIHDLSRVESGRSGPALQVLDVRGVTQQIWAQFKPQAEERQLGLDLDLPEEALLVRADPDQTIQVLINLVDNALRYTPAGGRVRLAVARAGPQAHIQVSDTGEGIPAAALPYLFERFYRVDQSRSRQSGGTGIGLTISRHLARGMAGDLVAASPGRGQGSTFTFSLPLAG